GQIDRRINLQKLQDLPASGGLSIDEILVGDFQSLEGRDLPACLTNLRFQGFELVENRAWLQANGLFIGGERLAHEEVWASEPLEEEGNACRGDERREQILPDQVDDPDVGLCTQVLEH